MKRKTLHPKLIPFKTTRRLATAQGSTLTNYGKIQFFLVPTRTMEQKKLMSKLFNFHITDIKHIIIEIPFITKYIPTINILNSRIQLKDEHTKMKNTALTLFQRINKQPLFFSKFYPKDNQERKHLKPLADYLHNNPSNFKVDTKNKRYQEIMFFDWKNNLKKKQLPRDLKDDTISLYIRDNNIFIYLTLNSDQFINFSE